MVGSTTDSEASQANTSQRDRGQVILIGAIALAFIILGIVVVFNGVLYIETISSSATSQSAADAAVTQHELEKGVAGIIHRQNIDDTEYGTEQYSTLFTNVSSNSGPVITDISVTDDSSSGAAVATGEIDSDVFNGNNISRDGEDPQVGHLRLEVEEFGGSLDIDTPEESVTIDDQMVDHEPAQIDLVAGTVNGTSHSELQLFDPETSYEQVEAELHGDIEGEYELVTKDENTLAPRFSGTTGSWAIEATVTYDSNDVSFSQTYDIPVYGGDP
ncbi:hypothetical protein C482_11368 [Natrialba chahannaoensis JCM 10990]|uniref:Uncharacterized protein n=1 Tax=Natrialba chahannaoensis JCM 10990 TaxID=1227492 RepID=M0ANA9_9EURY|nr:hypothetical protein [Natrialba chahannaoensis]ELY98873.1 hypothetical protein C482_11368 [Natrialba chahannaoensis JCM 10990]